MERYLQLRNLQTTVLGSYLKKFVEIGGKVIDRTRNVGITTTMKNFISITPSESNHMYNAGWSVDTFPVSDASTGSFNVCIPLKCLLGFAEDFKRILLNVRQELVLIRS